MSSTVPPDVLDAVRSALAPHYEIERTLGSGAMGSVLLGRDTTLERPVAIKIINPELAATASFRQRFLQEARTVARLRHGGIVAVHAAGEAGGVLYFVMEFVPGESLRDLLEREGRLEPARAVAILRDLADALAVAHRTGIIHRDIKPENILLDRETGRPKLTDFGISRSLAVAGAERMTGTGMSVGTPAYMSPEQAAGERDVDGRSDLYALGLVGYEMLSGQQTFTGKSAASVIVKQITEPPPPLVERAEGIPPALAAVIERALAKDPDQRWQDGDAFARALEEALGARLSALGTASTAADPGGANVRPSAESTRPPLAGTRPSAARRWLLAGAGALAAAALGFWGLSRGPGAPGAAEARKSILVVPFNVMSPDPSVGWLRDGSVSMLALNLAQWKDLRVVDYERVLDLLRDAKLEGRPVSLGDARRLADRAGVWTVVMGEIQKPTPNDSLVVIAKIYDVAGDASKPVETARAVAAPGADPRPIFDKLASDLLGLAGAPTGTKPTELARTTTASVDAYRHYLAGLRALNGWKLDEADSLFARALAADSTFALAYYKRSLASGWRAPNDTITGHWSRRALAHAGRLPLRERMLVEGYHQQQQRNYGEAQRKYAELLARDSADAEAWYGLGDAYFHDPKSPRDRSLTQALRAFNRTVALDSTFHLAYQHRIEIFRDGGRPAGFVLVEGDSVLYLSPEDGQRLGRARVDAARKRSRELAIRDAQQWVYADAEAPNAYLSLADAHAAAGEFDRAIETLRQAQAKPATRRPDFFYKIAAYQLGRQSPEALPALRQALKEAPAESLRARGGAQAFNAVLNAINVALWHGAMADMDRAFETLFAMRPTIPTGGRGAPASTAHVFSSFRLSIASLVGLSGGDSTAAVRQIREVARTIDAIPDAAGDQARREAAGLNIAGYMLTRDTAFLGAFSRWAKTDVPPQVQAIAALDRGDTARARALAARFRPADTTAIVRGEGGSFSSGTMEAEVLTRLGEPRRALAMLEGVTPEDFNLAGLDPRWIFYPMSLPQRADLYEQVGDRARADSALARFVEMWKDADPRVQPLVRQARARLQALRDAPAGRAVEMKRP